MNIIIVITYEVMFFEKLNLKKMQIDGAAGTFTILLFNDDKANQCRILVRIFLFLFVKLFNQVFSFCYVISTMLNVKVYFTNTTNAGI